jgi:hypothetical protein
MNDVIGSVCRHDSHTEGIGRLDRSIVPQEQVARVGADHQIRSRGVLVAEDSIIESVGEGLSAALVEVGLSDVVRACERKN